MIRPLPILAGAVFGLLLLLGALFTVDMANKHLLHPVPQYWIVILDSNQTYVGQLGGKVHLAGNLTLHDVHYINPPTPPATGFTLIRQRDEVAWPWQMEIAASHVKLILPVNNESPLGKVLENQKR